MTMLETRPMAPSFRPLFVGDVDGVDGGAEVVITAILGGQWMYLRLSQVSNTLTRVSVAVAGRRNGCETKGWAHARTPGRSRRRRRRRDRNRRPARLLRTVRRRRLRDR